MIGAGELDRRLTLLKPQRTKDESGATVETFVTAASVWGQAIPLRGRELFQAQELAADVDYRFRIRYRSDLDPTWRIGFDGRVFQLRSVLEVRRRELLELLAKARAEAA